ncbi:MAG: class I tRNA ligase family protein, partial [Muribaculaceae bacterium]|nr:class I tRNA ligase family protein [Muribaculaceae bacterium]
VVNPDDIVERYGADTLRLYEMFLGPLEQSKPWDTNGIDGVNRFLKKFWGLYFKGDNVAVTDDAPTADNLRSLHKLIKKVTSDIENFSFNTSVAAFMICVNELSQQKCTSRAILEPLAVLLAPFAPHIVEELWHKALGHAEADSIVNANWPELDEKYLQESSVNYAVSFNGKTRFTISMPADADAKAVETAALGSDQAAKWLDGKTVRKVIVVPRKIVNIVVG